MGWTSGAYCNHLYSFKRSPFIKDSYWGNLERDSEPVAYGHCRFQGVGRLWSPFTKLSSHSWRTDSHCLHGVLLDNSIRRNKLFDIFYRHWSNHLLQTSLSHRSLEGKKCVSLFYCMLFFHCFKLYLEDGNVSFSNWIILIFLFPQMYEPSDCTVHYTCGYQAAERLTGLDPDEP